MANTKNRVLRVDDELWTSAQDKARENGETVSAVIRRALGAYVKGAAVLACAAVALVVLSGCGASGNAAPAATQAVRTAPVAAPVESAEPSATPTCWSSAASTWMDDYNAVTTDDAAALAVLDALPDAQFGCTTADFSDLVRAHELATEIRAQQ